MPDYDLGTARGKIELDSSQLGRASAAFSGLGRSMVLTGGLAVGAFALVVKSAADFEKVMSAVGAVTNASTAEMEAMSNMALELGSTTVYGADEIGRAMEQLAKAGLTIDEILGGATEATVTLAAAAGDELSGGVDQAAVVIANAMKTFGAGADELEHFSDVLVGAAASSTLSVDDIATSMTYAGPIAAQLGLSIDDLSAALAILGDRGIKGSTAGTSLRGVLLGLSTQTPKATKVMKELGLITEDGKNKFFDMEGSLKPIPEVMELLGNATKDLSEQEKIAAFNAIFQRRAMNSAMILAEQGAEGFDKYAAAIARIKASDVAAKKLDNLSGDMTLLKNSVETLIIKVGRPLQDMLRDWVQKITDLVSKLQELDPELLAQITLWVGVGGAVLVAAGGFLMMIGVAFKLYRNFILLKEAVGLLMGVIKLLSLSLLTNPWFLAAAAIVAIGVALYGAYKKSDAFRERVDKLWQAFQPVIQAVKDFVANFVEQFGYLIDVIKEGDDVAQGMAEIIDNMFGNTGALVGPILAIADALGWLWEAAKTAFQYFADVILPILWDFAIVVGQTIGAAVAWFLDTAIPAIQEFADAVIEQIGKAVDWFGKYVAPIFTETGGLIAAVIDRIIRVLKFFGPYFKFVWDMVVAVLRAARAIINSVVESILLVWDNFKDNLFRIIVGVWNRIKQTIESALRVIRGIITLFTGLFSGDWGKAWEGIKQIVSGAWALMGDIIQNAWFFIWNLLSLGVDLLISLWEVAWNTIKDIIKIAWNLIFSYVKGIFTAVLGFIKNHLLLIKNTFVSIWNTIVGWFGEKIKGIYTHAKNALNSVIEFFRGLWGKITGAVGDLGTKISNYFKPAFERMKTAASEKIEALKTTVKEIPGKITGALGDLGRILYQAGKDVIQGLLDGIDRMMGPLDEAVGAVAGAIGSFIPGSPVKKGPLRVLNRGYAGGQIVKMLATGIEDSIPKLEQMMGSGMGAALPTVTNPMTGTLPATASGAKAGTVISVNFEFPNVTSAQEAEAIERAVGDSNAMAKLVSVLKAGRR